MLKTLFYDIINNKRNRLAWIDYARGIAIVLVLYRHVFEGIKQSGIDIQHFLGLEHANIIFFSFRMPLFFIVSGVFMGGSLLKRGLNEFILNKWRIILYPYALWATIQVSLQLIFSQYVNGGREWTDYLYILYSPREIEQFWYLYALFNVTVLYAIVKVKLKLAPIQQLGLGLLTFYLSSWLVQHKISVYFLYDVLHFYIFFALGDLLSGIMKNPSNARYFGSWKTFFLLIPVFAATQYYFLVTNIRHASATYSYVEDYQPFAYAFIALAGCAFMINISNILQRYNTAKWLRVLGYHSIYIYVMHVIIIASTRVFITHVFGITYIPLLLAIGITVGLTVSVLVYQVAMKLGFWWLFSLERPKPKQTVDPSLIKTAASV